MSPGGEVDAQSLLVLAADGQNAEGDHAGAADEPVVLEHDDVQTVVHRLHAGRQASHAGTHDADVSQRLVGTANDLAIVMPRVFAAGNLDESQVMRPLDVDIRVSVGLVFRGEKPGEALGKFLDAAEKAFGE